MQTFFTSSPEETEAIGARLSSALVTRGDRRAYVSLFGEMGVGKTAFVRGFCQSLGIRAVRSPTYTVVNEYRGGRVPVFHFDFYRIEDEDDLVSVGFEDYIKAEGYCLAEWSENVPAAAPPSAIRVTLARTDGGTGRKIVMEGEGLSL